MNKRFRKTVVAAAVASLGVWTGTASAFEYAMSHTLIESLAFTPNTLQPESFTFNLTNTASLNGVPAIQVASCGGAFPGPNTCSPISPVLDALPAEVPGGARGGNNNFNFLGPSNVNSYATSDSVIRTAQLVQFVPTNVESISEVNIAVNGTAQSGAIIQSNTTATVNVLAQGNFDLTFLADPDLRAAIASLPGVHSAQANLNTSFTIRSNTDTTRFISWTPEGTAGNDCVVSATLAALGVTCAELFDTQDLNINVGTGTNPSDITHSFDAANILTQFGIRVAGLPLDRYSLVLNTDTSANVLSLVQLPEPGSLALLGLGLLGMGIGLRRRIGTA